MTTIGCRQVPDVSQHQPVRIGDRFFDARTKQPGVRPLGQVSQVPPQHLGTPGVTVQEKMHPGPGLFVVDPLHVGNVLELFQPFQVRLPAVGNRRGQPVGVLGIDPSGLGTHHLEILGQSLVQPQRDSLQRRMENPVSELMAEIFLDPVTPERVDGQSPGGAHKIRSPAGQLRIRRCQEGLVFAAAGEHVHDHLPRRLGQ